MYFSSQPKMTGNDLSDFGLRMLEGQVVKVHFVDSPTNKSKNYVEYDVQARSANGGSTKYANCRYVQDLSGFNDFSETVLEPSEVALQGKLDSENFAKNMNGAMVVLAFLDGELSKPVIIGGFAHRRNTGATRADGIRKKTEFRGIVTEINKDGEWSLTYKSPNSPDGKRLRSSTAPTFLKIDKEGNFTLAQEASGAIVNSVKYDRTNEKKTEIVGKQNAIKEEMDGKNEKVTLTFKSGLTVTIDGKDDFVKIQTKEGASVLVDGKNDVIELKDKASGKIKLKGEKVAIGASSAELLQQISDSLQKIITWTNTVGAIHDHLGNLGYPTAVPTQASGYTTLGTELSTIKGLVDGIKGTL